MTVSGDECEAVCVDILGGSCKLATLLKILLELNWRLFSNVRLRNIGRLYFGGTVV